MPSPKVEPVVLSDAERQVLTGWARRRKTAQALAIRSRIVLACAEGGSNAEVSARLGVSRDMVPQWRTRFLAGRLEGLSDEPRPGAPRKITDEQVDRVIAKTLESAPSNSDSHWSTRSMATETGMSQSAIWRAFGLKPHVVQTWKLTDPQFVDKVRDVVGLYMSPPENALVLCVDEKSQTQALDRTAPTLPIMPTTPARMTHDYVRNTTTNLFAAFDLASGSVIAEMHPRHRHQEFLRFLKAIRYRSARRVRSAPDPGQLRHPHDSRGQEVAAAPPPVPPAFHPTSASWMNLAERWFAELTSRRLRRSAPPQRHELKADIQGWINTWNTAPRNRSCGPRPPDEILETLAAYCQRINDSGR